MAVNGEPKEENPFSKIKFVEHYKRDPAVEAKIAGSVLSLQSKDLSPNPIVDQYFEDPNLFGALPDEIRESDEKLEEVIYNCGKFHDILHKEQSKRYAKDTSGLFGDKVFTRELEDPNGRGRIAEEGFKLNVSYLNSLGIDPEKVLFFRRTQPSGDAPKPEYYWTSDYSEALKGLTAEITGERRKTSVILVATLNTINQNEGLIQDINDDSGISVRQIGIEPFDQSKALAIVRHQ